MLPTEGTPYSPLVTSRDNYPKDFEISELGEKLFGLRAW